MFVLKQAIKGVSKITDGYNRDMDVGWSVLSHKKPLLELISLQSTEILNFTSEKNKALIAELSVPRPGTKDLFFPTQYSQSFLVQCMACLWKQRWSYWRNPSYTAVRFVFTTFIGIIFGTMFWDIGGKRDNPQNLMNSIGSMYGAVLFLGIQNASAVQPV
ncbi:pleiotropic drug resistance protein 1-like protein, partial [Tanacetum coccineum]